MLLKRLLFGLISLAMLGSLSLTPITVALATPTNLITNPGVETPSPTNANLPSGWLQGNWGANSAVFSYDSAAAHSGNYGVEVQMNSYTNGDAKWYFTPVNVTAGSTYNYTDFYKSSVATDVMIQYSNSAGTLSYVDLGEQAASPTNWSQVNDTFVVPAGDTQLTVFHLINSVGYLQTDDYSLTASTPVPTVTLTSPTANSNLSGNVSLSATATGAPTSITPNPVASVQFTLDGNDIGSPVTASPYNLTWDSDQTTNGTHEFGAIVTSDGGTTASSTPVTVNIDNATPAGGNLIANPGVETPSSITSGTPLDWLQGNWGTNSAVFSYDSAAAHSGNYGVEVQMNSYTSGDAKWYFDPVNISASKSYTYTDFYKSSAPTDVMIQYSNSAGALSYVDLGEQAASPTNWSEVNDTFTTPSTATQMTMFHLINSVGYLQTDDYSLTAAAVVAPTPTVSLSSPAVNSTLTGNTTLTATTTNTSSVKSVQFTLDGQHIGSPLTTSPYSLTWDTDQTTNGAHNFGATVTPVSGANINSAPVAVEISNPNPLGGNLVPNPNDLTASSTTPTNPQDWSIDNWGTNTATFSYLPAGSGYNGSRALSVNMTSYTSGDGKWSFTPQNIAPDTQYKFSEYYESNVNTEVDAVFNMTNGTTEYQIIGLPGPASTWTNFTSEFVVPQGTANVTIYHLLENVGQLSTSDFSMSAYNPVGFKRPLVTLTFDDGYVNEYTEGLALLEKYGFTSTQFVITDLIGQTGYMTNAEIQDMYLAGNEIASHTVTHSDLTQETSSAVTNELFESQTQLQSLIKAPVYDMAYPYGLYDSSVVSQVKNYYQAARGVEDGLNSKDNFDAYDIKVQNIYNTTTTAQVADWVKQAQATNTWLVIVYHSVDPDVNSAIDGGIYNVTPTQLSAELSAIKSSGVAVETMHQAVAEVEAQL
ncbi:MAG TPA: Ig-like domain-containing protein [Candidatus Saccharimonadales bacterium]|nr:Ig-like domain-containing protein [Candidatus Saccharimonadales bacterium]